MSQSEDVSWNVVCAIPARYASQRLPGKPLREIAGKTMIEHVYRRAQEADGVDHVVVLTDDERILDAVEAFGGSCEMTPVDCPSGTDRIAYAARSWNCDVVINLQGDEPLIDPREITELAQHMTSNKEDAMATLATQVDPAELDDPNRVKVVFGKDGQALYFSRAGIPFQRDNSETRAVAVWRHVGIYAYRRETLLRLTELEPSPLEQSEALEQLRALENGIPIRILTAREAPIGVDTESDLSHVESILLESGGDRYSQELNADPSRSRAFSSGRSALEPVGANS